MITNKSSMLTSEVIAKSGINFGTSGARGLVSQFSVNACAAFTHAFVSHIENSFEFDSVALAIDNRPSSYDMAMSCAETLKQRNIKPVFYGVIPTPALAYTAMKQSIPSIMVTGSHIPFDRNGLKFYRPDGEIDKRDEQAIVNAREEFNPINEITDIEINPYGGLDYITRYTSLFDTNTLSGLRIGIYEHSSAGRELYSKLFSDLGADVISLGRTDKFVPIDTEAVTEDDQKRAIKWSEKYQFDAIFSTDGDGDRPLVADENGQWLRGDILGILAAKALSIEALAIPVSCNTSVELTSYFKHTSRTKIGSPYVIDEFASLTRKYSSVAGFEANGGFLLGSDVPFSGQVISALPTRDAVLPFIMLLYLAKQKNVHISSLVSKLPKRFTNSDRLKEFPKEQSENIVHQSNLSPQKFIDDLGFRDIAVSDINSLDGVRFTLSTGDIIHLRPSGNAPELRCYAESDSIEKARDLVTTVLNKIQSLKL
ncbi:phosphomannomutase [Vibrio salinus]|uniref:phosphomannomutase n=1 Tax=Vibrio salinus TaxID=2899784 RepID=UPI001E52998B|nr:phosphomannomutase [Vibrio salinus]MCE0493794.1 phosphomannomutase [Vibrio salinus]